jgi:gamma-tubulin complex component 3
MADTEQHLHRQKQQLEQEEQALLRECLYSLQGIDGERIQYYYRHDEDNPHPPLPTFATYEGIRIKSFALDQRLLYEGRVLETKLGTGAEDALRICGEAGWFYTRIQSYIHEVQQGDQAKGVVARAFAEGLAEQLREFHSLLTDYEQRLQDMSLRQLMIELQAPTNRLKILAMLADGLRMYRGGHLLTALYKHSIHGNTVHCSIVATLLQKASRPWFEILYMWTTQGVLSDPWNEFFVVEKEDVDDKFLWQEKYSINLDLVPTGILGRDLVVPAFKVGKGINFIRRCLMDGRWTMHLSASGEDGDDTRMSDDTSDGNNNRELGYRYAPHKIGDFENEALKKTLTIAGSLVNSHILQTLKEENHLMQHLFALKQFLLLGQGDFFSALMEGLHNEYSNTGERSSVTGIYKHSLLSIVEGALRSTNAKYLPQYAIDRLQVELLLNPGEETGDVWGPKDIPEGSNDGRTVYDVFMLDYQVPDPIMAVVHPTALERYKSVFSLLFRLKKIEFMLNFTWRQSATLSHALQTSAQYTGIDIHESEGYAQATFLLRNISILRQSMTHMVVNLKSYLMFEVIEGGWQRLSGTMEEVSTLDETIAAHDVYLNGIVRKSMVRDRGRDDPMQNHLADQVDMVLAITDEFCTLQEIIFRQSLRAADVAAEKRVEAESRLDRGQWGFDSEQENTEQETFFGLAEPTLLEEIRRISAAYNEHALGFLDALSDKVNGLSSDFENDANLNNLDQDPYGNSATRIRTFRDDDLDPQRFLIAQLDHNQYYADQAMGQ